MMTQLKYQMVIQWSEEDDCFLVCFPDFPEQQWRTMVIAMRKLSLTELEPSNRWLWHTKSLENPCRNPARFLLLLDQ
jgi:hypothetical protein